MPTDVNLTLKIQRGLPSQLADGQVGVTGADRASPYVEDYVLSAIPTKHLLADEGSYFVTTNPTIGTALAYNVQASFSDTVPLLYLFNKAGTTGTPRTRIWLDQIKLIVTVAAASGVQAYYAIVGDTVPRNISTNNMTLLTPVCPNMDLAPTSQLQVYAQSSATASAIAASSQQKRILARGSFGGVTIVGDELVIACGAPDPTAYPGLTAAQATCPGRKVSSSPPIILGPGTSAVVHLWFPSNATTGLSFELEMGHWER